MKPVKILRSSVLLDIQSLDESVYHAVIEEYVNCFSRHKGVLWIGQFGSIRAPGVSDIDLLVVCENEYYRTVALHSQKFVRQSPLHRYLFWHDVSVVPQTIIRYLFYMHSLENLQTLWGDADILKACEQPNEIITLFRTILWNSYFWNLILHHLYQNTLSLRSALLLSKNAIISAANNYCLMGNSEYARILLLQEQQERRRILDNHLGHQGNLAKVLFEKAIQTLFKSDWDLTGWMTQKGLCTKQSKQEKIQLSHGFIIIFDDSYKCRINDFPINFEKKQVTIYLPSFYYTISRLIAQPYFQLQPDLFKIWDVTVTKGIKSAEITSATKKWNEVLTKIFDNLREVGANPESYEVIVFPFNLRRHQVSSLYFQFRRLISIVRKYL